MPRILPRPSSTHLGAVKNMASYSTIPEVEELVERPKQKTSLTRLVAVSALVSFALGACAATLTYPGTPDSRPELVTNPSVKNHWYDTEPDADPGLTCWTDGRICIISGAALGRTWTVGSRGLE